MTLRQNVCWAACLAFVLMSAGCGGGDDGDDNDGGNNSDGGHAACKAPSGFEDDAGPDQHVKTGTIVQLDGSHSRGADGADPDSYKWSFTSRPDGSDARLSSSSSAAPQFKTDQNGKYVVKLVIDGKNQCDAQTDSVTIKAKPHGANSTPTADAGDDQIVTTGVTVHLNGDGSQDADGDGLDYAWGFVSRPDGSKARLKNAKSVAPMFKADTAGDYVVWLRVGDRPGSRGGDRSNISDRDKVKITARKKNAAPVARAGDDQSVKVDSVVRLDGSDSSDSDDRLISYHWHFLSKPEASDAKFKNSDTVRPIFTPDAPGSYVASLVVGNGKEKSRPDTVIVVARKHNSRPVANAGRDQDVKTGSLVKLNGTRSSDVDNDDLRYHWTLSARPKHSQTALVNTSKPQPSFTPDIKGRYVAQLVVDDGKARSQPDRVAVTASGGNSAPIANAGKDRTVGPQSQVKLDGSASSDADNDELSYHWTLVSRPSDSSASLNKAETVDPTFTADKLGFYVVSLVADDGHLKSAPDRVVIAAVPTARLYVYQSGGDDKPGYKQVDDAGGSADISLQAGADNALLNRFRLKANSGDYTIQNIQTSKSDNDSNTKIKPYFEGLSEGTRIKDGGKQDFATRLESVPSKKGQYKARLQFTLYPGGKKYNFVYNVNVSSD